MSAGRANNPLTECVESWNKCECFDRFEIWKCRKDDASDRFVKFLGPITSCIRRTQVKMWKCWGRKVSQYKMTTRMDRIGGNFLEAFFNKILTSKIVTRLKNSQTFSIYSLEKNVRRLIYKKKPFPLTPHWRVHSMKSDSTNYTSYYCQHVLEITFLSFINIWIRNTCYMMVSK